MLYNEEFIPHIILHFMPYFALYVIQIRDTDLITNDKYILQKEIAALKELSANAGCHEDEIAACKPRRRSKGKAESKYQVSSLSDVVFVVTLCTLR